MLLRGTILSTNWVERNNFTFNSTRWDEKNTPQLIWQSYREDTRIMWEATFTMQKEAKMVVSFDDIIGKYNERVGVVENSCIIEIILELRNGMLGCLMLD